MTLSVPSGFFRTAAAAAAFLAVIGASSLSSAVSFSGSYQIDAHNSGNGLLIQIQELADPLNFALNSVGDTYMVNLFKIWTDESDVGWDDTQPKPISAIFNFSAPQSTGAVSGTTVGGGFIWQEGRLTWNGPGLIDFGNGGVLRITLSDEVFNRGFFGLNEGWKKGAVVGATFELVSDTAAVPLPASLPLLMAGLGGLALLRRRGRTDA